MLFFQYWWEYFSKNYLNKTRFQHGKSIFRKFNFHARYNLIFLLHAWCQELSWNQIKQATDSLQSSALMDGHASVGLLFVVIIFKFLDKLSLASNRRRNAGMRTNATWLLSLLGFTSACVRDCQSSIDRIKMTFKDNWLYHKVFRA